MPTLLLVVFINFVGIGALIPVLPYTVIETLGLSASVMTLLLASFAMAMFLSNPLLGRLSDHIGRRPVLIASLFVNALAHLWFAFSDNIIQMFAARILAGLAAGNTGVIQAIIADRVASSERARYMGLFGAAIGTGFVAGPALGGLLAPLSLTPALRAATEVLILYTLSALPAVVVLALLLRGLPAGEARWLQWRASWLNWPQAGRGLLMSLPIVALSGWLVERFWPNAGGSNPLLEEVLNGRSSLALLMLAFTATVLAPLFEELLFRGVLLPVVGARWGIAAGIGVSALVFALAHLSLSEAPPLLALGIGLGWLRWSSGRLLSTVVMHGLWNGLTFFNLVLLGS